MTDIYEDSTYPDPVIRMPQTTQVRSYALVIAEQTAACVAFIIAAIFNKINVCVYTLIPAHTQKYHISSVV